VRIRALAAPIAVIIGAVTFSTTTSSASTNSFTSGSSEEVQAYSAGRYIVKVREDVSVDEVLDSYINLRDKSQMFDVVLHGFASELTIEEVAALSTDDRVLALTEDSIIRLTAPQTRSTIVGGDNDVWGLDRIDQRDLPLNDTFTAATNGENTYVYVVDTPIRTTHSQFSGRVLSGYSAPGISFTPGCDGHGTHVAGTVLGSTVGVAPGARLVPVQVLDCDGTGSLINVVAGVDWIITDVQTNNRQPAVVNLSLGGQVFADLDDAVTDLVAAGITVIAAAGNENQDACNVSPARTPIAITVAASSISDGEALFTVDGTNFGSCVDIFAPGTDILSAWSTGDEAGAFLDGTSMAAPHVAGVAALHLEAHPSATPSDVWNWMRVNATGCAITYNTSRVSQSPNRLLYSGSALGRPCPPKSVAATTGDSTSVVSWLAPNAFSGTESLTYSVSTNPPSAGCTSTGLSCALTGLVNGQTYTVSVTSSNSSFSSATATTTTVTPEGAPIAPTISSTSIGNASVTVSWGSVPSTTPVSYTATAQPGGQSCTTSQLSCTITGLTNGATYTFTVVASNVSGAGSVSAGSVVATYTTPPAPVVNRIRTKSKQISLRWDLLNVPYSPSYTVRIVGTSKFCTTTLDTCSISELTNGKRYRLTVTATNVVGDGLPSTKTANVVPGINVLRDTIPKKKKVALSKFITTLSAGRKTYKVTKGSCQISSGNLVAPSRTGSCTLQLSVSASGAYPSMSNTAVIKVI